MAKNDATRNVRPAVGSAKASGWAFVAMTALFVAQYASGIELSLIHGRLLLAFCAICLFGGLLRINRCALPGWHPLARWLAIGLVAAVVSSAVVVLAVLAAVTIFVNAGGSL